MENEKHAVVVVACVAGFGAWGASGINVGVANDATYAAELFGTGADKLSIAYPGGASPEVSVTWDQAFPYDSDNDGDIDGDDTPENRNPNLVANSTVEIRWELSNATFATTVQASDFTKSTAFGPVSIADGGKDGDSFVAITMNNAQDAAANAAFPARVVDNDGNITTQNVSFSVPRLTGISALADPTKKVAVTVRLRITTGSQTPVASTNTKPASLPFPTGKLGKANVVHSANAVTLAEAGTGRKGEMSTRIDIDERMMLRANAFSGLFTDGAAVQAYRPRTFLVGGDGGFAAQLAYLTLTVRSEVDGTVIHQWDGTRVDSDVAGVLDIDVSGAIREGDMVFANRDDDANWYSPYVGSTDNRTIDSGEALTVTEGMAEFTTGGFSIDPGQTDEDDPEDMSMIGVYYVPNGKDEVAHGAMIHLSAIVNYTRATTLDERAKTTTTELRFHGVDDEVKAYAIPFDGNGKGDMANVRIRCEAGDWFTGACRPFLECWDDMGMRMFGESASIAKNALDVLSSMEVEEVIGATDPATRHSCRVLSTGTTSVQTLVRDGTSGTLVNNSQVN